MLGIAANVEAIGNPERGWIDHVNVARSNIWDINTRQRASCFRVEPIRAGFTIQISRIDKRRHAGDGVRPGCGQMLYEPIPPLNEKQSRNCDCGQTCEKCEDGQVSQFS